ncbi:HipA N-terminal domain-containing protein [Halotalea alkalilenta]|uniref:HipA N-terminal domain-containing protein n=1 Tax=Halotalea alkalilenta TaxID=376489 RepID=UPI001CBB0539|nr:HipA N-terminal domain-containing protein [Halotalea alkalilenta]
MLPDSDAIRRRVAERFRTDSIDPFDLLTAIGRDCVGAVQILEENEEPEGFDRVEALPLSEKDCTKSFGRSLASSRRKAAAQVSGEPTLGERVWTSTCLICVMSKPTMSCVKPGLAM